MHRSKRTFVLLVLMVTVLACTGCSKPAEVSETAAQATETPAVTGTEEATEVPAETATEGPAAASASPIVAEWYFARALMDGQVKTAEQLGQSMHITLREDGSAENEQGKSSIVGTWEKNGDQVTITFGGSASTFTEKYDELFQMYDEQNGMFFTHEVAGIYHPGKITEQTDVAAFDGTWNVKWIQTGETCQSVAFLQENFGLESIYLVLEGGILKTDEANYGMLMNSGSLIFATEDGLKKMISLLDDGMLCFIDYENGGTYYCEKAQ